MNITGLRALHNWIKYHLISTYGKGADGLLDLGCGYGGDIKKWVYADIKNVIGFDINDKAIAEANRRLWEEMPEHTRICFFQLNTGQESIAEFLRDHQLSRTFDIVSNQFALHHLFASEAMCRQHVQNIVENLKPGGYYIGTVFDGELTFNLLKNIACGNKLVRSAGQGVWFSIKKHYDGHNGAFSEQSMFGQQIEVVLSGSPLINKPTKEYLVDLNKFADFVKPFGLELVESELFSAFFEKWETEHPKLSALEREFSSLNRTFVFRKHS